jgi:hypothetical protein
MISGDRRTIGGRSVLALDNVARAVVFGDCIRVQMPASSSFASIRLKAKVEKAFRMSYCLVFRPESLPIKNVATPTRATVPRQD